MLREKLISHALTALDFFSLKTSISDFFFCSSIVFQKKFPFNLHVADKVENENGTKLLLLRATMIVLRRF